MLMWALVLGLRLLLHMLLCELFQQKLNSTFSSLNPLLCALRSKKARTDKQAETNGDEVAPFVDCALLKSGGARRQKKFVEDQGDGAVGNRDNEDDNDDNDNITARTPVKKSSSTRTAKVLVAKDDEDSEELSADDVEDTAPVKRTKPTADDTGDVATRIQGKGSPQKRSR